MAMVRKTLEQVKREAATRSREKLPPRSEEEIRKAAESDPDTWLPTEEELKRFKPRRERAKPKAKELSEKPRKFRDED